MPTTHEEVCQALSVLSADDWKRLLLGAVKNRVYLQELGGSAPEDLLNTAVKKLLGLEKIWEPARFDIQTALRQAMRNLAGHEYTRLTQQPPPISLDDDSDEHSTPTPQADDNVLARIEAEDLRARFLASLPDERLRQVVVLRLEGATFEEIANCLAVSVASAHRFWKEAEQLWKAFLDQQQGTPD